MATNNDRLDLDGNHQRAMFIENIGEVDSRHKRIHEGVAFFTEGYDSSVASTSPKYWHIKTPDSAVRVHLTMVVSGTNSGLVEFYENPSLSGDGSSVSSYNHDRNSSNSADLNIYSDPTVDSDGTALLTTVMGNANKANLQGGGVVEKTEIILEQNQSYLIKFNADNDNTGVSMNLFWYEV